MAQIELATRISNFNKAVGWAERSLRKLMYSQRSERYIRSREQSSHPDQLIRFGTSYGGRVIGDALAQATISPEDYVLSCGAGQDLSFDVEIQRRYGCHIVIVDPVPLAHEHFSGLVQANRRGEKFPIDGEHANCYDLTGVDLDKFHFVPVAVWEKETKLRLWAPRKAEHVSHSVNNWQRSGKFMDVPTQTVATILSGFHLQTVPLLKLDIMGSEFAVLKSLMRDEILPRQISVRLYELEFPSARTFRRMTDVIDQMYAKGYQIQHREYSTKYQYPMKYLFVRTVP